MRQHESGKQMRTDKHERAGRLEPGVLRGIHLDFKYHCPNKAYLRDWVKRLPGFGINALLIEYEDAFPFRQYPFLAGPDAFSPDELREFLAAARGAGLTVIPLVQTFGHLEFALAHNELASLREKPEILSKICVQNPRAVQFVRDLLSEVLAYHQEDPYVHLGADEVGNTGWCEACGKRIAEVGPVRMWADHERPLLEWVLAQGKRPIVWDDVFWKDLKSVGTVGLPRGTILHAWGYNTTSLTPSNADPGDPEFGGPGGVLKQVESYREAGFDSVAGPCLNWGVLFPRHTHCLMNTQVWAKKMRAAGMLGLLNTSWAVFHIPQQMLNLYVAATGELCADPDAALDERWQEQWLEREFGGRATGVPVALEVLGAAWEIPTPDYGRPFTPVGYGYMNMVFHYPGRQKDRNSRGAYPADWDEIDFAALYRKGVEECRKSPEREAILTTLDGKLAAYPPAVGAIKALAAGATRQRDEAAMMAAFAELKLGSLRVFAHLMRGDALAETLLRELAGLEEPLRKAMARAWEPVGRARMWRAFYEPLVRVLQEEEQR
jgi:hypothetical protein